MYGMAFLLGLPLLGWWLIRMSRSLEKLASTANENGVKFDFLGHSGNHSAFKLLSDPRFIWWLLKRHYVDQDYPSAVIDALETARRKYVQMNFGVLMLIAVAFALGQFD